MYCNSCCRSDTLVPYEAMKWVEQALPSCTSTVVPGTSQALVHDRGVMEEVFAAVQNSLSDIRVSTVCNGLKREKRRFNELCLLSSIDVLP